MTEYHIRRADTGDLPAIQEIARRTIDKCYRSFLGDEGVDWFINSGESDNELETHLSSCDLLLRNGEIVAFTIYFDDLIHLMMVDVEFHRTGLGTRLLIYSENCLFEKPLKVIRLETFEGNIQAIDFYIKNGWTIIKKQTDEEFGFVRVYFEKQA